MGEGEEKRSPLLNLEEIRSYFSSETTTEVPTHQFQLTDCWKLTFFRSKKNWKKAPFWTNKQFVFLLPFCPRGANNVSKTKLGEGEGWKGRTGPTSMCVANFQTEEGGGEEIVAGCKNITSLSISITKDYLPLSFPRSRAIFKSGHKKRDFAAALFAAALWPNSD